MDVQAIISKASALVSAGDGAQALKVLSPLWAANKGHPKLARMMSAARVAAAQGSYGEGDHGAALEFLDAAIADDPAYPPAYAHRAIVTLRQGRPSEAEEDFRKALDLAGDAEGPHGWIWTQTASLARQGGDLARADALLAARLAAAPDDPDARYTQAFADLAGGRFAAGWQAYEQRWRVGGFPSVEKPTQRPRWTGEAVPDRLLVWREQGVGDEIMFARLFPDAAALANQTIVECDPRLTPLFRRSFPAIAFHPSAPDLTPTRVPDSDFDHQVPMGSLMHCLLGDAPIAGGAYLKASSERTAEIRESLQHAASGRKLVGISWWSKNAEHGQNRSPAADFWTPLLQAPDLALVSLQYQADIPPAFEGRVLDIEGLDPWQDLDGLAAAMTAMDHVVTIDNSTAHLAGALGVRTGLLLSTHVDWRWQMAQAGGAALYDSVRPHHQSKSGDWAPVFAAVLQAVRGGD